MEYPQGSQSASMSMDYPIFKTKTGDQAVSCTGTPTGIRTPVLALKGLRPSPLDDGGKKSAISQ